MRIIFNICIDFISKRVFTGIQVFESDVREKADFIKILKPGHYIRECGIILIKIQEL